MTETTLVTTTAATQVYTNPIARRFFNFLDSASDEFRQNGKLTFSTIEKIVGRAPVIPDSPDMDARMEAYDDLTQYSTKVLDIESKISTYAGKRS